MTFFWPLARPKIAKKNVIKSASSAASPAGGCASSRLDHGLKFYVIRRGCASSQIFTELSDSVPWFSFLTSPWELLSFCGSRLQQSKNPLTPGKPRQHARRRGAADRHQLLGQQTITVLDRQWQGQVLRITSYRSPLTLLFSEAAGTAEQISKNPVPRS